MAIAWNKNSAILLFTGGITITYLMTLFIPCRSMNFTWRAQPGHAQSFPMQLLDPAGNPTQEESYTLRIPLGKLERGISNEEILAGFSRGYFGGWMFSPERWIASLPVVRGVVDHDVVTNSRAAGCLKSDAYNITTLDGLSKGNLPPLGACLFGLYYLVDSSFCTREYRKKIFPNSAGIPRPERAFVEYAGRTKGRSLAASHRFEVVREVPEPVAAVASKATSGSTSTLENEEFITIIYSHVRSNPRTGGKVYSRPMTAMHVCYAHLLFADGVREVLAC